MGVGVPTMRSLGANLTAKERILLHLFDKVRYTGERDVPPERTQTGIAEAVNIRVQHASQYLRPMVREGLLDEEMRHIRGGVRRRKAYFLTPLGRRQAAVLRQGVLKESVPFKRRSGRVEFLPLVQICQEERQGVPLLTILRELQTTNCITSEPQQPAPLIVDLTLEAPPVTRFYGRDADLERALQELARTPVVVITGMPGVGKTALAVRVCDELRDTRPLFWRRVRPWDTAASLALDVATFLRAAGRGGLHAYLRASGPRELSDVEEHLAGDLLGLGALFVFDDVHQASEEAEAFFSLLSDLLTAREGNAALLLSRTALPFYSRREVDLRATVTELHLGALDMGSSQALLGSLGVTGDWVGPLARLGGGHPLFLNLLAKTNPRPAIEEGLALQAYIAEEIDSSLRPEERECIETASLYQLPVPPPALLLGHAGSTATLLGLQGRGLLETVRGGGYVLHDVLRDYFRSGLPRERRDLLAAKVVSWLEDEAERQTANGDRPTAIAYLQNAVSIDANPAGKASNLRRCGDLRGDIGDVPGALEAFREALRLTPDREFRASMRGRIAKGLETLGDMEGARREVEAGLALLPDGHRRGVGWLLAVRAGITFHSGRDYARALADIEEALRRIPEPGQGFTEAADPRDLFPPAQRQWAYLRFLRGAVGYNYPRSWNFEAMKADYEAAISVLEAGGWTELLPFVYSSFALAHLRAGDCGEARGLLDRASALLEEAEAAPGRSTCLLTMAWFAAECTGDYAGAAALYREGYRLAKRQHQRSRLAWHYRLLADLYRRQGRVQEAVESLEHFLTAGGDLVDPERRAESLCLMVRLRIRNDDLDGAGSYLRELDRLARRDPDALAYSIHWARGVVAVARGDLRRAEVDFERALADPHAVVTRAFIEEALATPFHKGEFLWEYAQFLHAVGKQGRGREVLVQAHAELEGHCLLPLAREARLLLESLEASTSGPRGRSTPPL